MDNNTLILKDAADCLQTIDIQYKLSDFNSKKQLKESRDNAFDVYSRARLKLLADEVLCTDQDVQTMKQLRQEIEQAAETQSLIQGILSLVQFLVIL